MTRALLAGPAAPVVPRAGRLSPLGLGQVEITGGFWGERQLLNAGSTLPHLERWLETEGWIANFDLAASGRLPHGRRGREFSDSEVYKLLEALAWEAGRSGDPEPDRRFRAIVARVAAAQEADGYLGTAFGRPGQPPRWSDLAWGHELYCLGHLFQAAVARARTAGPDDPLVTVACRAADLVCAEFGPGGRAGVCGHPEIEAGLAELARETQHPRYLAQAAAFVERRGQGVLPPIAWGPGYFQDDVPVRQARVLRGHAVRAGYLAAGATDVAADTGDAELLQALRTQWERTTGRRTYLTGGQGSNHRDESFGEDYDLPPDRAYSETCAGVASIMFSWRLLLASGGPGYADLIERTLYNVVATAVSADGRSFFYANTLHQRRPGPAPPADVASRDVAPAVRAPWFEVSCCPPNVARLLASLAGYVATTDDGGLQVHQYLPCRIRTVLPGGRQVSADVVTGYPRDGLVRIILREDSAGPWTLTLRIPAWAGEAGIRYLPVTGAPDTLPAGPGQTSLTRDFRAGDVVELALPVSPRYTVPDPRIDAVRGCATVERGPVVYCLESVDVRAAAEAAALTPERFLERARLDTGAEPRDDGAQIVVRLRTGRGDGSDWPYRTLVRPGTSGSDGRNAGPRPTSAAGLDDGTDVVDGPAVEVPLVPYHDWAQRGPSAMRVWLPRLR